MRNHKSFVREMVAAAAWIGLTGAAVAAEAPHSGSDGTASAPGSMQGFSVQAADAEAALEQRFDADLSASDLRSWMQQMSSAPNQVGSAHDKANAEFQLKKFREWGWNASIETFSVLYPTPREVRVELVAPTHFTARLTEPAIEGDSTSTQTDQELPAYNVYGADGDVTAELVYVNHGMPDDYKELERRGISVAGRIVLTRYGGGWRGLKPKLAFEHGAIGCLIYSDPRDDGYGAGDVYPQGGFRPKDAVQRGSVQDLILYSGDPLTPGVGATAGAKRLALKDAKTILKIPVLPLSYAAAEPLLAALAGPVAPASWRGGLPLAYHIGPGPAKVHLKVESDWSQKTIYDVIATLRGSQEPDRWVIRGNHHDGWVFGAADPLSGQVALMAEAKSIGKLAGQGWRPRRTLVYASWDGEEPGLLGSTEWAETHAAELRAKAVLYVNSDVSARGFLGVEGSHALQRFASEAARDVKDPETGVTVLARAEARERVKGFEAGHVTPAEGLELGALGSGSDYTPFLQHLGVSSVNLGFEGEGDYGVYHSAYDSYDHYRRFVDPTFEYGVALAKVAGRLMLRAAQADLIPAKEGDFAASVAGFADELHKLADGMRTKTRDESKLQDEDAYRLVSDPSAPRAPPPRDAQVPFLNFAELDNAVERLKQSAAAFDRVYARLSAAGDSTSAAERDRVNAVLATLEESLTDSRGLPGRDWYRHMLYAPGAHTGYGVKTLPGIREAIEERRWDEANQYMGVVSRALNAYSAGLDRAAALH
ncbi:MAG TPA: transferrin receptor-like dimerization domain-containing protein [Steroidobacteraceae bacterium]|jgi:N-acetylated-alpha-linked acidic dipeptidase|nr:transferrin receptor-like dimerization domain-containing protein [Steroidobacteraceae bacterium]